MDKYKVIAICGKSSSGKDTILNKIMNNDEVNKQLNKLIATTTRPKRENELDGVDYFFTSTEEFRSKKMLSSKCFNGWLYGVSEEQFSKELYNIGIFNPLALSDLYKDRMYEVYSIYIQSDDKTRLLRSLNREENPDCYEICRRFIADEKDFYMLEKFKNNNMYIISNAEEAIDAIKDILK